MGRKKRPTEEEVRAQEEKPRESDDSSSDVERKHYDIEPDIKQLCFTFGIDSGLTQKLNDIMVEDRQRTWEQDIQKLHEILKGAYSPQAMLTLKLRDMEKGVFVSKAKCGPVVQELAKRHRLDKGASTKLEDAMSIREAMGKDVDKDLALLDEHLTASNKPSALISMKLESLRKGFSIGHCIFSREPMPGNTGPGVDGVFDKRRPRAVGYTDADLDRRFAEQAFSSGAGTGLMDEAAARKMMQAERKQHEAKKQEVAREERRRRSAERSRSPRRRASPSPTRGGPCRSGSLSSGEKRGRRRIRSQSADGGKKEKDKQKRRSRSGRRHKSRSSGGSSESSSSSSSSSGNSRRAARRRRSGSRVRHKSRGKSRPKSGAKSSGRSRAKSCAHSGKSCSRTKKKSEKGERGEKTGRKSSQKKTPNTPGRTEKRKSSSPRKDKEDKRKLKEQKSSKKK